MDTPTRWEEQRKKRFKAQWSRRQSSTYTGVRKNRPRLAKCCKLNMISLSTKVGSKIDTFVSYKLPPSSLSQLALESGEKSTKWNLLGKSSLSPHVGTLGDGMLEVTTDNSMSRKNVEYLETAILGSNQVCLFVFWRLRRWNDCVEHLFKLQEASWVVALTVCSRREVRR